jgi:2,3-dihydroxy-p-cumate/2,3-dihydroxybenzoate 3,4-dioxygenase
MEHPNHPPIRFARLGYCRLQCSDLAATTRFYCDVMGLVVSRDTGGEVWLRCSDKPYDIMLQQGKPGLVGAGFEMESASDLDRAFTRLERLVADARWLSPDECLALQVERGLVFTDPVGGLCCTLYVGQACAPSPYVPQGVKIARLGHLVLNVPDLEAAHEFWCDALGFAVSDRVEGVAEWLRCWPNPLHHSLALLQHTASTLHHINFMVTDIDDIGVAMNRIKAADIPIVFGPGRHLPSTSIFLYFLDPDGNTNEFSFGMELFEEHGARLPRELEHKAEVMDIWGSRPDPRFGKGQPVLPIRAPEAAHG